MTASSLDHFEYRVVFGSAEELEAENESAAHRTNGR
jgi:hypothetical protein